MVAAVTCVKENHHKYYDKCGDPVEHYKDHDDMCL